MPTVVNLLPLAQQGYETPDAGPIQAFANNFGSVGGSTTGTQTFPASGGSGSGATFSLLRTGSPSQISTVTLVNAGNGYAVGDTLTVTDTRTTPNDVVTVQVTNVVSSVYQLTGGSGSATISRNITTPYDGTANLRVAANATFVNLEAGTKQTGSLARVAASTSYGVGVFARVTGSVISFSLVVYWWKDIAGTPASTASTVIASTTPSSSWVSRIGLATSPADAVYASLSVRFQAASGGSSVDADRFTIANYSDSTAVGQTNPFTGVVSVDAVGNTDAANAAVASAYTASATDSAHNVNNDTVTTVAVYSRSATDVAGGVDSASSTAAFSTTAADVAGGVDSFGLGHTLTLDDGASVTDSYVVSRALGLAALDVAGGVDGVDFFLSAWASRTGFTSVSGSAGRSQPTGNQDLSTVVGVSGLSTVVGVSGLSRAE